MTITRDTAERKSDGASKAAMRHADGEEQAHNAVHRKDMDNTICPICPRG